jgi:hypothetical protein
MARAERSVNIETGRIELLCAHRELVFRFRSSQDKSRV